MLNWVVLYQFGMIKQLVVKKLCNMRNKAYIQMARQLVMVHTTFTINSGRSVNDILVEVNWW